VRSLIAAVQDTRPRYATEAVLAHITVAQERRREAEETVVVQGQHDGDVRGGPEDRRGQGGKHVVAMDDVWSLPFDSPPHLVGGAGNQTRRRPVASFVMPSALDICGAKTST
jgi:hypothetical protein